MHELNCATPLPYNHHAHTHTWCWWGATHMRIYSHSHTLMLVVAYTVQVGPFGDGWRENVVSVVTTPAALLHPSLSLFLSLLQSFTRAWWCWCHHPFLFLSPTLFLSFFLCIFFSLDMVPWAANDKDWRKENGVVDFFFFFFLDGIFLLYLEGFFFLESLEIFHSLDVYLSVFVWVCVYGCCGDVADAW